MGEMDQLQNRMDIAHRAVSAGDSETALREARCLLKEYGNRPTVRFNCAGLLIDAGERLEDRDSVNQGITILRELQNSPEQAQKFANDLRYNLANGLASLVHMESRKRLSPDYCVRDLEREEEVVRLYYDASNRLSSEGPEVSINCASMLRVEGRLYEAIDLLDSVLVHHPFHPNAHMKIGEILWAAGMVCRGRDGRPESLFVAALWHLEQARLLFSVSGEVQFMHSVESSAAILRETIVKAIGIDPEAALEDIGIARLGNGLRAGHPLGLTLLTRSPYRDEDDPHLLELVPDKTRSILTDAAGTFALARALLTTIDGVKLSVPRWAQDTPSMSDHLRYAAVRQLWSVFEKIAWILNEQFALELKDSECSFARIFSPPTKKVRAELGIPHQATIDRHPNLDQENPGLLALSGIAYAFRGGVYDPLKRLRHAVEHRSPAPPIDESDAAFFLGIARAGILHAARSQEYHLPTMKQGLDAARAPMPHEIGASQDVPGNMYQGTPIGGDTMSLPGPADINDSNYAMTHHTHPGGTSAHPSGIDFATAVQTNSPGSIWATSNPNNFNLLWRAPTGEWLQSEIPLFYIGGP